MGHGGTSFTSCHSIAGSALDPLPALTFPRVPKGSRSRSTGELLPVHQRGRPLVPHLQALRGAPQTAGTCGARGTVWRWSTRARGESGRPAPRNISEQPRRLRVAGAARRSARSYKRDTKWCPPERWPIPATSTLRTHEDQHRRRTVSKVKAIDWKHLAKRGWQLALLLIVPGGSIVVLALWWLELSREVPFEVHP